MKMKKIAGICMACNGLYRQYSWDVRSKSSRRPGRRQASRLLKALPWLKARRLGKTVQPHAGSYRRSLAPTVNYLVWTGEQWNNAPQGGKTRCGSGGACGRSAVKTA